MKNKKIIYERICVLIGIFILLAANALAFAVSAKYHEGNPLFLEPGKSQEVKFTLQNLGGTEDVFIMAEILTGKTFLRFTDASDVYTVPAGGKATVNLIAEIPNNAEIKDAYRVDIRFTTATPNTPGSFILGSSIIQRFDIIVGEGWIIYEEKPINWGFYLLIGVLIIAALIAIILGARRIKRKKK